MQSHTHQMRAHTFDLTHRTCTHSYSHTHIHTQTLYFTVPHGFPWTPHGLLIVLMESSWSPHGVPMESPWRPHGLPIVLMESSWSPRGVLMDFVWTMVNFGEICLIECNS